MKILEDGRVEEKTLKNEDRREEGQEKSRKEEC